eukprot:COSAG06_NODE_1399_length_9580_cov_24.435292_3_plen_45_part_00
MRTKNKPLRFKQKQKRHRDDDDDKEEEVAAVSFGRFVLLPSYIS